MAALQASAEVQSRKLVASTLARVQKEGAIRKSLEQYQEQLAASNLARDALSTTVTTALKRLALATSTQAQRVDSVETHLASLVERNASCKCSRCAGRAGRCIWSAMQCRWWRWRWLCLRWG